MRYSWFPQSCLAISILPFVVFGLCSQSSRRSSISKFIESTASQTLKKNDISHKYFQDYETIQAIAICEAVLNAICTLIVPFVIYFACRNPRIHPNLKFLITYYEISYVIGMFCRSVIMLYQLGIIQIKGYIISQCR